MHFTFVLLLAFLIFYGLGEGQSGGLKVVYIVSLFASVILHEIGHAVAARHYGVKALEIVMFPIGGVARLDRIPKAAQEFWIALAGPLVNLAIAAALFGFLLWRGALAPLASLAQPSDANLLQRIAFGNLLLAGFNLLPAYPMDGGRILRSLLALRRPPEQATRLAARTGQFFAMALGFYGLFTMNFMLVFIAFFVYAGAGVEVWQAMGRIYTHGVPVSSAMVTDFRTLPHASTIREAASLLLATTQQDFPVMHGDQVTGLLGRAALLKAMATDGPDSYVASAMNRDFVRLSPDHDLGEAMQTLAGSGSCALVMEGDRLTGLLTTENLNEFVLLRLVGMQREK